MSLSVSVSLSVTKSTPGLCGVFKATKWAVVGNSGVSALGPYGVHCTNIAKAMSASGCAPVNYVGWGPLQAATPSSAGRIAAKPASILRSRENQSVHPAKTVPGTHTDFLFTRLRSLRCAQAHSRLRGRHVTMRENTTETGRRRAEILTSRGTRNRITNNPHRSVEHQVSVSAAIQTDLFKPRSVCS